MAQLLVNLLVWSRPARRFVGLSTGNSLENVQVILHVLQCAVIWKSGEARTDGLFGCHWTLPPSYHRRKLPRDQPHGRAKPGALSGGPITLHNKGLCI